MSDDSSVQRTDATEERVHIADAHFAVEARLAIQLGRESISSSITALLELVKNAYDAEASSVRIRFKGLGTHSPQMVIEDDGRGMTSDDLLNNWMVIGTTNKLKLRRAGTKRVLTGEKGLGRLGLDRLARRTTVQSIVGEASEGIELPIDWSRFEQEDVRLENVGLKVYGIPNLGRDPLTGEWRDYPHGTRLVLDDLKDDWSASTLADLRAELSLLVSPFSPGAEFRIELDSGLRLPSLDGVVETPRSLLHAAQWRVTASIDEDGSVRMRMASERHNRVYEDGPTQWENRFPGSGATPQCGPLRFEFYFFPRRAATLGDQAISLTAFRTFLDANQGLRVYRDGFRVKPYGNPNGDGDWLRLAFRRTINPEGVAQDEKPGNWRVGYNQVVGAVFVSREKNAALLDQTNREGLVDGKAFTHLRAFAEETVRFFELNNQDFEMSRPPKKAQREEAKMQAAEALKNLSNAAGALAALAGSPGEPLSIAPPPSVPSEHAALLADVHLALANAREQLEESSKVFRAEDERESRAKDTMANLASLGILAAAFGHETLGWASSCVANAGWLERNLPKHFFFPKAEEEHKVKEKLADTVTQARRIETFAAFSIGNVKPEKRKRTTFSLKRVVQNVFKTFDDSLRVQRGIELDVEGNLPPEPCHIKGYPIDWESVLVNLITNAEWALRERNGTYQRVIRVTLGADGSSYLLTFDDNGIGIPAGQEERIFLPTVSTKRNASGLISGTGMGLTIVRSFVEENTGGSITAVARGELGGASFRIRVPAATPGDPEP
jgi:signal transduction histidine kinase